MGEIWFARDSTKSEDVAVKIVPILDNAGQASLIEEGNIALALHHPNIVSVYHIGVFTDSESKYFYMVMEIAKESLSDLIVRQSGMIIPRDALSIMVQITSAMAEAHKLIVHRDLKPDNILLDSSGLPKVTDFGLAKYVTAATRSHTFKGWGTYAYMAPECWLLDANTPRMDIYSMAIMFFELLTGTKPFTANNENEWRDKHLYEALPDLQTFRDDLPSRLVDTISKMASKRADDRYADGSSLLLVLREIEKEFQSESSGEDPLVAKAMNIIGREKAHQLETQRQNDEAERESKLLEVSIDSLFSMFSKRVDKINLQLEQRKIETRIHSGQTLQLERVRIFNPVFPHLVEYPRSWSGSQTTFFRHPGR